jgi:predicted O-methyltransferase YrrM
MEVTLNKKKYSDTGLFISKYIEEYCNLKIYPLVGVLEREVGLLSDLAKEITKEGIKCNCIIYTKKTSEISQFFCDSLTNFNKKVISSEINYKFIDTNIIFVWDNSINQLTKLDNIGVLLTNNNEYYNSYFKYSVKLSNSDKVLYISDRYVYHIFQEKFYYYFDSMNNFNYDNLVCYSMIIKNGGPLLKQVLTENLDIIDRWCILDTGSTDGTQDIIREVLKNKKGSLYEEPFINFRDSRNRCLDLAGKSCKFIIMLDDTYIVNNCKKLREFLNEIRGDQVSDSFSMVIQSNDNEYFSNRIIKSDSNLRYIHKIHEVITPKNNMNINVPYEKACIFDYRAEYMESRTNDRKKYDLQLLFEEYEEDPSDPRNLYYIAQTYSCLGDLLNKAKYFELRMIHPNEGYIQEKVDAIFELARVYNFHISPITKDPFVNRQLTQEEWNICENLYIQAYELDKKRPDSLYFIGIHYYQNNDYEKAYTYLKMGFEVGYPLVSSQYSLKPTLSFHFLPKFLTEVCYTVRDYALGVSAADLFLTSQMNNKPEYSPDVKLVTNWKIINQSMDSMSELPINKEPTKYPLPMYCIVTTGGWSKWTGKDILTKGMGGSETWLIETARSIKKNNDCYVVVFCNTDVPEIFEDVGYNPIELFPHFLTNNVIDHCILSRCPHYIPICIHENIMNIHLIFHDFLEDRTILIDNIKLKNIFGLTDHHCNYIKNMFPTMASKVKKINYGINKFDNSEIIKVKNSFIYSSFPNRGLLILLRVWKQIRNRFKNATLNIYCDLDHEWTNEHYSEQIIEIKQLLINLSGEGITNHSWVNKETLSRAWKSAEYFFYPCIFPETFCLTAMEAAITKTFVITNNLAALSETVGNRGLVIEGDCYSKNWQDEILTELFKYMDSTLDKELLIEKNYQWASSRSWENQTKLFMENFSTNTRIETADEFKTWIDDVPPGNIQIFYEVFKMLPTKKNKILEVGTYTGKGLIGFLENIPDSVATVIDPWKSYDEYAYSINKKTMVVNIEEEKIEEKFYKNVSKYIYRIKVLKGKSADKLLDLFLAGEKFTFIYIDGSHKCLDVYLDAMLAWELLETGGIIGFDDYLFNKGQVLESPYEAIEHFLADKVGSGQGEVVVGGVGGGGYRVFVRRGAALCRT